MTRRAVSLAVAAALLAGAAAGCGGGDDADGPASIVPADAPLYFEAVVRPEGEAADDASAALGKIIDSDDPGQEVIGLIEDSAKEEGEDFDFERDIEPWLGERIGSYAAKPGEEGSGTVVVAEATDAEAGVEYLSTQDDATGEKKEYEGTEYELDSDGEVFGMVDDFIVTGDEEGFKQVVDTADGDDSLGGSDTYTDSVDDLPSERLATIYALPKNFIEALPESDVDPQSRKFFLDALGDAGEDPILGDVTASENDISLEFSAAGGGEVSTEESSLVSELPADAWLGIGFADIGAAVQNGLDSIDSAGIPGLDAAAVREQLRSAVGINLEQDVIDTLGDAALFVEGTTENAVGGALVIESKDPAASAQLLTKLQTLITQRASPQDAKVQPLASAGGDQGFQVVDPSGELAQPVQVVQRADRIVVGYGAKSVQQGLTAQSGGAGLADSPAFSGAQEAIGDLGIDAFLSFAPAFQFAEATGAKSDPNFQRAKPYIDSLDFLALGSGSEDDRAIARFVLGLK